MPTGQQFRLTITRLTCIAPTEIGKSESVRLNVIVGGYCAYSGTHTMNLMVVWELNETFLFRENDLARIEAWTNRANSTPVFLGMIPAKTKASSDMVFKASDGTPHYVLRYQVEEDDTEVSVTTTTKTFGSHTRSVQSDGWGRVQLYFKDSDIPGSPYLGKYEQSHEKDSQGNVLANYCGPTAGKNVAAWYGTSDKSYVTVGQLMKANNYFSDPEIVGIIMLCGLIIDPIMAAAAVTVLNVIKPGGTLPKYMKQYLDRDDVRPPNRTAKWKNLADSPYLSSAALEYEVRSRLKSGHPTVALVYTSGGALHWLLITGLYQRDEDNVWMVRLANMDPEPWSRFVQMWQLSGLSSAEMELLKIVHINPLTRMYF